MILYIRKASEEEEWVECENVKIPYGGGALHYIDRNWKSHTVFMDGCILISIDGKTIHSNKEE